MTSEHVTTARERLTARPRHEQEMTRHAERQSSALEAISKWTQFTSEHMGQRNDVLETSTAVLGPDGACERSYRAPYASVAVANTTTHTLTVASGGKGNTPGAGAGQFTVPAGTFMSLPLVGDAITFYGTATAGEVFTFSVLTRPVTPTASKIV